MLESECCVFFMWIRSFWKRYGKYLLFWKQKACVLFTYSIQHTLSESAIELRFRDSDITFKALILLELTHAGNHTCFQIMLPELSYEDALVECNLITLEGRREDILCVHVLILLSHCLTLVINCMICCHPKFVKLGIEKQTEKIILTI
jgi:hypothetical protein